MNVQMYKKPLALFQFAVLLTSLVSCFGSADPVHAATLASDDFESGNANNWTVQSGSWSVAADSGSEVYSGDTSSGAGMTIMKASSSTDYKIGADIKVVSAWNSTGKAGLVTRYQDSSNYYMMLYQNSTSKMTIIRRSGGTNTVLATSDVINVYPDHYNTFEFEVNGSSLTGYLNHREVVSTADNTLSSGSAGLRTSDQQALFDNVIESDLVETVWNVNNLYGITQSGIASAIADAKTYFISHPHATLVLQFDPGTYSLNNDNGSTTGIIDISNVDPGASDGRLVFRGAGEDGTNSTTLIFEDTIPSIYGKNVYHVTFEKMHLTVPNLKVSQGTVVSVTPSQVVLDIQSGFPTPNDIYDPNSSTGRYLRRYDNTDPLDPKIIDNSTWPSPTNAQLAWSSTSQVSGYTNRWQINFKTTADVSNYRVGDLVGIKSKHGGQAYFLTGGSDFVFDHIKWTRETRGVFRGGFNNIRVSNCTISRDDAINGQVPALTSPDGGPQLGQPNDPAISGIVVENCNFTGTGDDAIAYFNVTGIIRSNTISDSFARGILLQNSSATTDLWDNILVRDVVLNNP